MKDLTAKPCNLFQKIAAPLLAVCATGVLGGQLLVYLWRGVIMPVMLLVNAIGPILGSLCMSAFLLCVALTVLILTVGHSPVCIFARKKKAEIPAEV